MFKTVFHIKKKKLMAGITNMLITSMINAIKYINKQMIKNNAFDFVLTLLNGNGFLSPTHPSAFFKHSVLLLFTSPKTVSPLLELLPL